MSQRGYRIGLAAMMLLALFGLGYYWIQATRQVNGFGFPLDDSWIHLQIARNLASGHGWSFNPGEPTGAATSPLWVLIITPLFYLGGDVTVWVKALGVLLYLANVLLVANVAMLTVGDRRVGVGAGMLAAMQPALIWAALSGMETALYLLLFLLSLRSLFLSEQRGRPAAYASTVWLSLAGWARPEMWALLPLLWGYLLWRRRELPTGHWWVHVGLASLAIGGFALFNMALWGHPIPTTLVAKQAILGVFDQETGVVALLAWVGCVSDNIDATLRSQNSVLLATLAAGLLTAQQRPAVGRCLLLLLGVIAVGAAVIAYVNVGDMTFQTYRRSAYMLASMNILVATGFIATCDLLKSRSYEAGADRNADEQVLWGLRLGRWRLGDLIILGLVVMALLVQVYAVRIWGNRYVNDVRSINQGDVAAGQWLAANTPPDARIAANDIGAIAYFGQRSIFDMMGLASPEAIDVWSGTDRVPDERNLQLKELLLSQEVDYVAIFPSWFPRLAGDPMLREVQRFTVEFPSAIGGREVVIYRIEQHP